MFRTAFMVLFLVTVGICTAQLNFSTGWGKRAGIGTATTVNESACKPSVDSVMMLYKIIQSEAQRLVECERFSK